MIVLRPLFGERGVRPDFFVIVPVERSHVGPAGYGTALSPIRLAILSDNKLFREGLRRILESDPSFALVAENDGTQLDPLLQETSPHILLADGRMEGGISLVRRETRSRPWVIMLGAETDDDWAVRALVSGARGVLEKDAGTEDLRKAIAVVHAGEIWARKEVVARIVEKMTGLAGPADEEKAQMVSRLSAREQEIVFDAANGLSNKEIAEHIAISQATVKAHLTKIFQKLKVRDRAQLAALYHRSFSTHVGWQEPRRAGSRFAEGE